MADLDQLMSLAGAEAAFTMSSRGELKESKIVDGSRINTTALDLLAHMCIANMSIATMQARGWAAQSDAQGFYPIEGFTLVGMDWSAVTNGRVGVILNNNVADYEAANAALAAVGGAA